MSKSEPHETYDLRTTENPTVVIDHEQVKTNINKLGRQAVIVQVMTVSSNQIQVVGNKNKKPMASVVNIK